MQIVSHLAKNGYPTPCVDSQQQSHLFTATSIYIGPKPLSPEENSDDLRKMLSTHGNKITNLSQVRVGDVIVIAPAIHGKKPANEEEEKIWHGYIMYVTKIEPNGDVVVGTRYDLHYMPPLRALELVSCRPSSSYEEINVVRELDNKHYERGLVIYGTEANSKNPEIARKNTLVFLKTNGHVVAKKVLEFYIGRANDKNKQDVGQVFKLCVSHENIEHAFTMEQLYLRHLMNQLETTDLGFTHEPLPRQSYIYGPEYDCNTVVARVVARAIEQTAKSKL